MGNQTGKIDKQSVTASKNITKEKNKHGNMLGRKKKSHTGSKTNNTIGGDKLEGSGERRKTIMIP